MKEIIWYSFVLHFG